MGPSQPSRHTLLGSPRGAVAVLVAVLLVVLIGFVALAVDVGYLYVTRNELQNTADAAALAAARKLSSYYQNMTFEQQQIYDCSSDASYPCEPIVATAQAVGLENQAGNAAVAIAAADVEFGRWNPATTPKFTAGTLRPNAVRVTARRDGAINGPVATLLAGVVGVDTLAVNAQAVAGLSGQSNADPGDLELPVGISRWWFDNNACNDVIAFSPSNSPDSCAGWSSWDYNSNDANLRKILEEKLESPGTQSGESVFNFIGGDLSTNTFDALETLFQHQGYDIDANGDPILDAEGHPVAQATEEQGAVPLYDADGSRLFYPDGTPRNRHEWPTTVVVYDRGDCSNPNQSIMVLGFARVRMTEVLGPPDKSIRAVVECNYVTPEETRGGGGAYGTYGSIPGLLQ